MNGLLERDGRSNQAWVPALDVWETESELLYALDPGILEANISVSRTFGVLRRSSDRGLTRRDRPRPFPKVAA